MAKINLLPWRDERRERLKQEFYSNLGITVVGMGLIVAVVYLAINGGIKQQNARNAYIQQHIDKLNQDVAEIAELKKSRAQLIERMDIIQGLQGRRPVIVRIFDQFVRTLPDGLYYTKLLRSSQNIEIEGTAESNNRVSSLMRSLDGSDWFSNPNLTSVTSNPAFGEQANNFSLTVALSTPGEEVEGEE
jgi:type IV pilus assembly protein PilN